MSLAGYSSALVATRRDRFRFTGKRNRGHAL